MDSQIRFPDGSRYPVKGWVSKDGAETYESSNKKFYKIGAEEGKSKNSIRKLDISWSDECADYNNKAIDMKNNGAAGDSGGPIFLLTENDTAFILAMTQYRVGTAYTTGCSLSPESGGSGGIAAWWFQNNTDLTFDVT